MPRYVLVSSASVADFNLPQVSTHNFIHMATTTNDNNNNK